MTMRRLWVTGLAVSTALAVAGCAQATPPSAMPSGAVSTGPAVASGQPTSGAVLFALPVDSALAHGPGATQVPCAGIAVDALLHGGLTDPGVTWLDDAALGHLDLVWPPGYTARFVPSLEVLDAAGKVVFRGGQHITGVCTTGTNNLYWIPQP
jgi:hypothetical protein